ncbi:MAG TPA: hypothetical protein ENG69_03520 [Candidatus Korarchaeota archaeon]|nr:hypothetical protein [Candidatus Korarchaeota archaeon]
MLLDILPAALAGITSAIATDVMTKRFAKRLRDKGLVGIDVHKPGKPEVPEGAGFAVIVGSAVGCVTLWLLSPGSHISGFLGAASLGALIGALDDRLDLGGVKKPALTLAAALPLIATGAVHPRPLLPVAGRARLFITISGILPIYMSVVTNAVNMFDALNGMMPLSAAIACGSLAVIGAITGSPATVSLSLVLLGAVLAYYRYNRYPAKVFSGNVGSMGVGAALAAVPVFDGLEAFLLIAMLPLMVSGFFLLSSIGGLKERRQIGTRPVVVEEGLIRANPDPKAPITLVAILTLDRAKEEWEIVRETHYLTALSAILAIVTLLMFTPGW